MADARALGAEVPEHRALDIADYDEVAAFAADIHTPTTAAMDVVMNVAGISAWGTVEHLTHRHWQPMIDVNLMGPIHVIETFVPPMMAAGRGGQLVNVSSAAGLVALPWHAAYSASKFGLRGLSEVLRFDLDRHASGCRWWCRARSRRRWSTPCEIAGVDREHPTVQRLVRLFAGHAVSPEKVAEKILAGVAEEPLPDLHLAGHPGALRLQTPGVVALQRGDDAGSTCSSPGRCGRAAAGGGRGLARTRHSAELIVRTAAPAPGVPRAGAPGGRARRGPAPAAPRP